MTMTMLIFAVLACLFHLMAFALESLLFMRPEVHRRFSARTLEQAETLKLMAFNQGFYNLFLVIGCVTGMIAWYQGYAVSGATLVIFSCACMTAAGAVLAFSAPDKLRVALMQGGPPAVVIALFMI